MDKNKIKDVVSSHFIKKDNFQKIISKFERKVKSETKDLQTIYYVKISNSCYKIGITKNYISERYSKTCLNEKFENYVYTTSLYAKQVEKIIKEHFSEIQDMKKATCNKALLEKCNINTETEFFVVDVLQIFND